jgi:uncharacterized protein
MAQPHVSLDLMEYIEQQVLSRYTAFDKAHDLTHVTRVIRRSLDLARQMGADLDMSYTIAAYHDLGLEGPRAVHHVTSGKILMADKKLRKWFTPTQLTMMKEAVEDHRASAAKAPRSIYGKIVAEADRDLEPDTVIQRTIDFGKSQHPEYDKEQHWQRFMEHMNNKYSLHGYIRLWIPGSKNEQYLKELRELIDHPEQMRERFDKLFEG